MERRKKERKTQNKQDKQNNAQQTLTLA